MHVLLYYDSLYDCLRKTYEYFLIHKIEALKEVDLKMKIGDWFVGNIIGGGIYELIDYGINTSGTFYVIAKSKKIFLTMNDREHETTCHPVNIRIFNKLKIVKSNKNGRT